MKRYLIENAKYGITDGGIACGPVDGNVVVTVKYNDGESCKWLSVVDVMGTLNFFLLDKDAHDEIMKEDIKDESFTNYLNDHYITEFDGLEIGMEYGEAIENLSENGDDPAAAMIRYVLYLTYSDEESTKKMIAESIGKYADELEVPMKEMEEAFM